MEPLVSPWSADAEIDVEVGDDRPRSRLVRTMPGDRTRRGARTLRWAAGLIALLAVVGQGLAMYGVGDDQGFEPYGNGAARLGQYLASISWTLGLAALVLAASFVLGAYAARLDLEWVLAGRDD